MIVQQVILLFDLMNPIIKIKSYHGKQIAVSLNLIPLFRQIGTPLQLVYANLVQTNYK